MATVTAADVNKLRQQTGAGMMDCRKALVESDGDFEKAVDYLRKKGQKVSALRSDRETREGAVIAKTASDGKSGAIVCVSCETDFVAKNQEFIDFAQAVTDLALASKPSGLEALLTSQLDGTPIQTRIDELVAKIGEKITLSRYEQVSGEHVSSYIHGNYRIGVLVGFNQAISAEDARNVAMQIAAMNPVAVDAASVPADVLAREREIAVEQVKAEGKPAEMAEKIAQGKVNKFLKESTLAGQAFVKDPNLTVADYLKSLSPELKVLGFKRVQLG